MSKKAPDLSVLLLSEDSSRSAFPILCALAKELFKLIDQHTQTQPAKILLEPLRAQDALNVLHANLWKSTNPKHRHGQIDLVNRIATQIMLPNGWVLFHFDGDRPWSNQESSENVRKFQKHIIERVLLIIRGHLQKNAFKAAAQSDTEAQIQARIARIKTLVPFYSIEAWLYQNTREAIRLCRSHHGGRDIEHFEKWEEDRSLLDEVEKPKEHVCLGSAHNLALAVESFPAKNVFDSGKSFNKTVHEMGKDEELKTALRQTYSS